MREFEKKNLFPRLINWLINSKKSKKINRLDLFEVLLSTIPCLDP
jgi:hypothetical protein